MSYSDLERIEKELDAFMEWATDDKSLVTRTSCILFAEYMQQKAIKERDEALAEIEQCKRDADRLMYACESFDGFCHVSKDKYDFAMECAAENGREEPTKEDELNGIRRLIDAALSLQQAEVKP